MFINFKKITASVLAISALAMGSFGITVNAAEVTTPFIPEIIEYDVTGYVSFGPSNHATASIYSTPSYVYLGTSNQYGSSVTVKLYEISYSSLNESENSGNRNSRKDKTYAGTYSVSRYYDGSGISSAKGYHTTNENGNLYSVITAY